MDFSHIFSHKHDTNIFFYKGILKQRLLLVYTHTPTVNFLDFSINRGSVVSTTSSKAALTHTDNHQKL